MKQVTVKHFASLKEQAGCAEETVQVEADRIVDLYKFMAHKHQFSLAPSQVKACVSGRFVALESPLEDGAEVAFIPPVAGG
jgi:molybdopterin synthase sulfur carrier subunit